MYIGIDGSIINTKIEQIKDALVFNFSIDKLDIPFNTLYGIRKNINNGSTEIIEEALEAEISQMITDRPFFNGVEYEGIKVVGDKAYVVVTLANETLTIPLE